MTTIVKIFAGPGDGKKVQVAISRGRSLETFTMFHGEAREATIFDGQTITVREVDINQFYFSGSENKEVKA